ncbi:MAG: NADH-quinone oxidoreductase subunit NuoH [Gemmatimonadetes bacterium]|jgi:NADH-quinone oxidoreductase subunit H|nr:NADH-quinone oxidoreductase subunit NuoH [Gemmatimonadota bacterium]HBD99617.1 NADH-quinone oxidoreductase subunit NuoH [Gemmatimonadota bacterium]|tara:strand:+ start:1193 stop:2476 length:1284 start_codon:yes stop_codon:yes gene_type:complete
MEFQPISGIWAIVAMSLKVTGMFTVLMLVVAYTTLAERRVSAWIQDRHGPNRVGPFGLLQPIADGLKSILKEETVPATASRVFFVLAPMLVLAPALVTFAVIPFAAPLPTPAGVVDMIVADIPIGILYVLAFSSLAVYGVVLGGWASNNKYAFLGALRASAQMVSYEVALGLSLITVLMLAGNVTLTEIVWQQQQLGMWFAFPLSLAFILFVISAFAETNRLPFDMAEAESELITGYHTEYSAMKFSAFMIGEFGHMVTASALMATLFLGGWDLPGTWDNAFWYDGQLIKGFAADGTVVLASPALWKTLATFGGFAAKTGFFLLLFIWIRWTLPRFRYDQVMALGWKVMLPTALAYVMLIGGSILVLDEVGVPWGFSYGAALTAVSTVATVGFVFFLDRGRTITGAAAQYAQKVEVKTISQPASAGD